MSSTVNQFWWRWLIVANIILLVFGLSLIFTPDLIQAWFNLLIFGTTAHPASFSAEAISYLKFTTAILGAVTAGWSVALFYIILKPFKQGERWAWDTVTASLAFWFIVDGFASITMGYPANLIQNVVFALLYGIPLAATYRHFHR